MPLHPFVRKMMDAAREAGMPALSGGSPADARALVAAGRAALGSGPEPASVVEMRVPTRSGSVAARLYRPHAGEHGLLVYLHGGGWVCGALDDYDVLARFLVRESGCAVLMVDYRLAPEHAFPAGLEDAEDAFAWAAAEMPRLLGRSLPLVVGGDSAGGNLCTVAAAALRGKVDIALQLLFYPVTDSDTGRPSYREHGEGLPLTAADMRWFLGHYAPQPLWADPRIAPLRHPDLAGSPPAWIATAEYDVLRDEGEAYAEHLRAAGVPVELHRAEGLAHGFARLGNLLEPAAAMLAEAGKAIRAHCEAAASAAAADAKPDTGSYDAVVVGAGFAGLYMLYRLRRLGLRVKVFEAGDDVGGTWYWNRYPGARCDVESMEYSYSFSEELQQEWSWSERYATQPEILRYIHHVADRFELRRDVQLNTRVDGAEFDRTSNRWTVTTDQGDRVEAPFCIMATGCLSTAKLPEVNGLESFRGNWYHTGFWPSEPVDFTGKRVAVIGTGSSGIQLIPQVAQQAAQLHVFQRTANYSLPARNMPLDPAVELSTKQRYGAVRKQARESPSGVAHFNVPTRSALEVGEEERRQAYEERWRVGGIGLTRAFNDVLLSEEANATAADFVRAKIHEMVDDPQVAALLTPSYRIGTKRLCADTGYFQTYNRPNVTLVDIRKAPIAAITPEGLKTQDGIEYSFDAIIFATGFDAMTGTLLAMDIHVKDGPALREQWEHGPRTYLGIMTAGLPNLFMITAPGSPSVLSNVLVSIEQHVDWITDCLVHLKEAGHDRIEADAAAQDAWVAHVNEVADRTLLPKGASWYVGANVPGKPRVFMPYVGGVGVYRIKCREVAEAGYPGFRLSSVAALVA